MNELKFDFSKYKIDSKKESITPEDIINDAKGHLQKLDDSLFVVKTGNEWIDQAKQKPIPKMLFSEFWHESELCILFADTNLGKSILAVQIGRNLSEGKREIGFYSEAAKQSVLYFDFELSEKQFEARYSIDYKDHYEFSNLFYRAEIDPEAEIPEQFPSFEVYLSHCLEQSIMKYKSKVIIIDNLTYLKNETEKSKHALPLIKELKALKRKYDLSLLVLAHTPKRDLSKPLTRNDLAGSKTLINFVDSAFTIGESHQDKHLRYLKQIKARNTEIRYDAENVMLCQIVKHDNFLGFEFLKYTTEKEHLRTLSDKDKETKVKEVVQLKSEGVSNVEIAKRFGVSEGAVRKWIKKHKKETNNESD